MSKIKTVSFTVAPVLMWGLYFTPAVVSQAGSTASVLAGTVKSKDGKSMEGVGVSARNDTQTFTTTVYTNQNGAYSFPQLDDGHYKIWAQAVGFDAAVKQTSLVSGQSSQVELTLTPIEHYEKQLSGVEWVTSLPEKPGDERMKVLITTNCTGCHTASFPLQNRFDVAGWRRILDLMAKISSEGYIREGAKTDEVITAYEDELAEYLARVRGPDSKLDLKPLPRPTGEATRIVVTEYDLTRPDMPPGWLMKHNGSDWSEGTPSRWDGRSAHDVALDKNGNVWFADDSTPDRTVGKLDPRTGKVTDYKLPSATKVTESTHAIAIDRDGNVWLADNTEGNPLEFDPKTSTFHKFPRPADFPFVGTSSRWTLKETRGLPRRTELTSSIPEPGNTRTIRLANPARGIMTLPSID
jgi:virginiamycin B lyase